MTSKQGPNDAYLWALMCDLICKAGVTDYERLARQLVALVRRARDEKRRTFAPGDPIPYDVTEATDLDGDRWVRLGTAVNERDMWRMPGFDPDEHESAAQGCQLTPFLLDTYGPMTELAR